MPILMVNDREIMRMSHAHIPFHTPAKSGDRRWKIVDEKSGRIIDQYRPSSATKPQPITPFKGSWAESMQTLKRP